MAVGSARRGLANGAWAMCVLLANLVVAGCSDGARPDAVEAGGADAAAPAIELADAEVTTVARHVLVRRLPISGSLTPFTEAVVKARVAGEVLEVSVREGAAVRAGDLLVRLDTRRLEASVASARAALEKAHADLEIARLNYENALRLHEKRVVARNELDTRRSVQDAAAAAEKLAAAQLRLAQIALDDAVVRAPFDAVVARRFVDPGGQVAPDSPLFELVDLGRLELQAAAPAAEIPAVVPGQVARVRVDGYGERLFEAQLERINPSAEQGSRLVMLYLTLDNHESLLRSGMFAQGNLLIEQTTPVLAVPAAAIVNDTGLDYVMTIENGILQRRRVETGIHADNDDLVEVRSGLEEGERILALRLASLEPGTAVRVAPTAAASTRG